MLFALSTLAPVQENGMDETDYVMLKSLNYCATNMYAMVRYKASDMIIAIHSYAPYL